MSFYSIFFTLILLFNTSLIAQEVLSQTTKQKKIYPMGEKIYNKLCNQNIDFTKYVTINDLQNSLTHANLCKPMKENHLEAVALYLWDVKRVALPLKTTEHIQVAEDEKCPICGMFVYKYPRWAAQIFYQTTHYSFDGVKDLMKYYFEHEQGISKILVSDYYSQKSIEAREAYFVIGSDVYGAMGDELIPFEFEKDAKTFYMDHKGAKIVKFTNITQEEIYKLDE